ncbi:MAG: hypothetical protein PHS44_03670 [Candidatus Dojkabacteria bacterium]|nr:hypothetical protein [Candidatus Dojkabacteria bacterium]
MEDTEAEQVIEQLTTAQRIGKERIIHSSEVSVARSKDAIAHGVSFISFRFGPMLSGKTEGTIRDLIALADEGITIHTFKLKGDDRYVSSSEEVGSLSGLSIEADSIESISEISRLIRSGEIKKGEVIGVVELPFMCPSRDVLIEFLYLMRERGIILIADGLGFWFNTQPLEMVEIMLEHADIAFYMQSWDTINPYQFAEASLRCVRVVIQNGIISVLDDDALYYLSLAQYELRLLIQKFQQSQYSLEKIRQRRGIIQTGPFVVSYLPSHPSLDTLKAIGGPERYIPISIETLRALYNVLDIDFEPVDPYEVVAGFSNVYDWSVAGLVLR